MTCVKGIKRSLPWCFTHDCWPESEPCKTARIAELQADLSDTLRAVLYHFGPDGANKVTTSVLAEKAKR